MTRHLERRALRWLGMTSGLGGSGKAGTYAKPREASCAGMGAQSGGEQLSQPRPAAGGHTLTPSRRPRQWRARSPLSRRNILFRVLALAFGSLVCALLTGLAALFSHGRSLPPSDGAYGMTLWESLHDPFVFIVWGQLVIAGAVIGFLLALPLLWRSDLRKAVPTVILATVAASAASASLGVLASVGTALSIGIAVMLAFRLHPRALRSMSSLMVFLMLGACQAQPANSVAPGRSDYEYPEYDLPVRPRIESRPLAIALFPVQLVPDIFANAIVALYPGNLWPIQYLLYPFSVPYWGITDAWEGRPFWDPSALYE